MRWLNLMVAGAAWAQMFELQPAAVRQGETLRVQSRAPATAARMNGRTVRKMVMEKIEVNPELEDAFFKMPGKHENFYKGVYR